MKFVRDFKLLNILFAICVILLSCPLVVVFLTGVASAASTAYINITATGAEVDISCNQTLWNVGTVTANDNVSTGDAWARITNNTSDDVDITIHGHDMENAGETRTWTLSDNGTNGAAIIGMQAAQSGGTFSITIKKNAAFNPIATSLASAATQDFGMCFIAPLSNVGNDAMVMDGEAGHPSDNPCGVCLTASLSP